MNNVKVEVLITFDCTQEHYDKLMVETDEFNREVEEDLKEESVTNYKMTMKKVT